MNKTISSNGVRGIVLAIFSLLAVVPVVSAAVADQDAKAAQKTPDTAEAHLKKAMASLFHTGWESMSNLISGEAMAQSEIQHHAAWSSH